MGILSTIPEVKKCGSPQTLLNTTQTLSIFGVAGFHGFVSERDFRYLLRENCEGLAQELLKRSSFDSIGQARDRPLGLGRAEAHVRQRTMQERTRILRFASRLRTGHRGRARKRRR